MSTDVSVSDELAGLDALEAVPERGDRGRRLWRSTWPKLLAIVIGIASWQIVVETGWRPRSILAPPTEVFPSLWDMLTTGTFWGQVATTMQRAILGFAVAVAIGLVIGFAVARFAVLRAAFGSLITGLQTMPSIAWFPLAIVLFQGGDAAIFFVIVLGAAPSVANGVLAGVDYVPPLLVRAGRNMGASGFGLYRTVIGPASFPAILAGLKQGWAFSWRSLMAGELIVPIGEAGGLGTLLTVTRELSEYAQMLGVMIVILVIGIIADGVFSWANNALRRRWGLS
ncbi:ABC transporter permease [Cryptosporangium arvum]|uniref:ABC-type nitrate/sulfonate/bicarbonate transport system, permease component n=1 Tax=Cryptosporangium arvum DSM 44712 TaxID=927661 RepID=A0A011AAU8_9ACTN|nr:ABC transporter permease [Cryptosporangium arvum]EXG79151.1 ABC-type nitrate/sulfonate/bicarbonate transport system, permease component [Cryptosporangium arvum DSM 44712]